jgi:mycofactocin system creatininase family protein
VSSARLADLTWPEVGERVAHGAILAVPIGSTEQHGPHLPLSVDTDIALALCNRLAAARLDVLVAPAVAYGSSGEHADFPGTLSIGQEAVELLLLELGRSAAETFGHVLFVSAHGGNAEPVGRAVRRLRREGRDACVFLPRWDGEPHAGRAETAMMLALTPERVRMQRAEPGDLRPLAETLPELRRDGVRAVSRNGVLGDPTSATPGEGAEVLDRLAADLRATVAAWHDLVPA